MKCKKKHFGKWGGDQRLYGTFPEIHLFWFRHPSLIAAYLFHTKYKKDHIVWSLLILLSMTIVTLYEGLIFCKCQQSHLHRKWPQVWFTIYILSLLISKCFSIKSHLRGNHIDAWWACRCWHEHCSTETAVDHRSQVFYTRPPKLGAGVVPSPKAASSAQPHGAMRKKLSRGSLSQPRPSLLSAAFTNDGSRTLEKEFQPAWWLRIPKQLFVYQLLRQTHDIALDDQRWIRNWLALHQIMVWLLRFCL